MIYYDSYEAETLRKMIAYKKESLKKLTGKAYQIVQREIMFLENDVLPVILRNTNLIHAEFAKYAVKAYDTALQYKCNGILFYQSIHDEYTEHPVIGIANTKYFQPYGQSGSIHVCIDNMDGNGTKVEPIHLPINGLM